MYSQALIATGQTQKLKIFLEDWWANKTLPRDDQKFIYKTYGQYLTRDAHLKRLDRLLFAGQYTNARAIARLLGNGYPELAEARIALAEGSPGVNGAIQKVPRRLLSDPGLLYERLHWRRENDETDGAIEILRQARKVTTAISNPEDWWKERHIIIRRLLEQKKYRSAYDLAADHGQTDGLSLAQAEFMAGWLALRYLHKPDAAYRHFVNLYKNVETPISKTRGSYWAGRALAAMGNTEDAAKWYRDAAQYQTTYYGQIAAAELKVQGELPNMAPPRLSSEQQTALKNNELVQTAQIFLKAGMKYDAGAFMDAFLDKNDSPEAYRFAADLALENGDYRDAVRIAKDATKKGLFLTAQSYPVITDSMRNIDLEWALVHAIIRQESLFDPEARSSAGALGLMQLLPSTAQETARKIGARHSTNMLTSSPAHNILIGSAFLKSLVNRYDGSYAMAAAAYNAGPGRVSKWIEIFGDPRKGEIDIIDWIELIPIYETRNYVQRVVENTYVYRLRLRGVQKDPQVSVNMATPQNLQKL
ncbi:MAG: lytic transglycosylase domain-containing protein [Alphaproteobacteria bacterium]|nr:lytic transglycosylase domain-containing protein [Alphaproteobacteria bacterium]MCD8570335.1 lytic transglycosylase domain-containing protein [Alphaproteobacteria bacterium]